MVFQEITHRLAGKRHYLFPLMVMVALFICFWKLGSEPLHQWDESRNGVNAIEMLQNHDYVNLYYGGLPDTWNAKPPLMIWMIAGSFKIIGTNEFALRFPSAVAIFFSFIILYRIIKLYGSDLLAFTTCLILMTVNGLIGSHVGRTGDFDALFILFLLSATYFALKYLDFNRTNALFYCGIAMGMAFYTKGLAALIILPGFAFYLLITKRFLKILKDCRLWIAALIFAVFIISWYLVVSVHGLKFEESVYGSVDSFETMWKYDILQRLTEGFANGHIRNYAFFFNYLDARFNLWNYLFYLVLAITIYKLVKKDWKVTDYEKNPLIKLALFSFCIWASIGLFLTFAVETHNWYLAPALPFVAITTAIGCGYLIKHYRYAGLVIIGLLLFTLTRKIIDLSSSDGYPEMLLSNEQIIKDAGKIVCLNIDRQDYFCYMKMLNGNVEPVFQTRDDAMLQSRIRQNENASEIESRGPVILFLNKENYSTDLQKIINFEIIAEDGQYLLAAMDVD